MPDKRIEAKWFLGTLLFLVLYCTFLLCCRVVLTRLENAHRTILKPEYSQIVIVGLIILLYHFSFIGLYVFSLLGKAFKTCTLVLGLLITGSILYGFSQWYSAIAHNPFIGIGQPIILPWYAREKTKFLIVNGPLILFFISIFVRRTFMIGKHRISK